ncbi:hypothetical protein TpMuguga_03g02230 [Theileria parva strain Muguga]|uniref:uncharacterized protein n=1 Tax=Theileria parva strain Muguga TaxID=333668 RepID=UPI001C61D26D|nr:uncharacterized protein TpMuguga_03g02230 [Theileria parva strain Muguga]KAF5153154.1 hypothetical protein TpMuguga_03g02230 [Theileria parva strain Muguga]
MTIPYCCHIISRIEIEYNSPSKPPRWLIYALKNPRIKLNSFDENLLKLSKIDYFNSHNDVNYEEYENNASIKEENHSIVVSKQYNIGSISLEDNSVASPNREEEIKPMVQSLITKSMAYYISLYEDTSKDDTSNVSKGPAPISRNSAYEMISGLRDCLSQLYQCDSSSNEAVIITSDYSGIFSHNEILITRSNILFLQELKAKEIQYTTIYDDIEPFYRDTSSFKPKDEELSELINSYLTNTPIQYSKSPNSTVNRLKLKKDDKRISKIYLLKSLKLPFSEDYDINVIRIIGRRNCQKLFKILENNTLSSLVKLNQPVNGERSDIICVNLILSNFSVLYSKVNQAHFKLSPTDDIYKMFIRGVILPSSLMSFLNILKLLESAELINRPTIRIKYNLAFDDQMFGKTLRISDSKIYDHFLANFLEIKKNYIYSYKALKKLIPFKTFTLQNGNISITDEKMMIQALENEKQMYLEDEKQLYLDNISGVKGTKLAVYESSSSPDIILLKETLYSNLSKIKCYLRPIQASKNLFTGSTKSFLDEAFKSISFNYSNQTHFNTKLYLDLYPNHTDTTINAVDTNNTVDSVNNINTVNSVDMYNVNILPYNLVNIIWILLYLLHCSGKMDFWDETSLENVRNNDLFALNLKETPIKVTKEVYQFVISKSLNFPLSQQSYYVHLVNRINFNKQFKTTFKMDFLEYLTEPKFDFNLYQSEKIQNVEEILQTSSGWNTYFGMKSDSSDKNTNNTTDTIPDNNNTVDALDTVNTTTQTVTIKTVINVNNSIEKEYSFELGTVYSLSRNEGRVYECNFDLIQDKFDNINSYNLLDSSDNSLNYPKSSKGKLDSHTILVLLFSNDPSVDECVNLKVIRNVLNSDLIKFSTKTFNYHDFSLNVLNRSNVIKFMSLFTANEFPDDFTTGPKILTKNLISYSILSSDFDIQDLHNIKLRTNKTEVNLVCVPLIEGDFSKFSKSTVKMIRSFNELKTDYLNSFNMNFVDISWIFDSYFQGIMNINSIPQEYLIHLPQEYYTQYSVDNFSIQDFKDDNSSQYRLTMDELNDFMSSQINPTQFNTNSQMFGFTQLNTNYQVCGEGYMDLDSEIDMNSPLDNISVSLRFKENYKNLKYFWGWNVYVLRDSNSSQLTSQDFVLYRKYCGITMFTFDTLAEIKAHIEETTAESLLKFNITPEDVETFLFHEKIILNTVVISNNGSTPDNTNPADLIIYPAIKSKTICLGSYPGIPVLTYSWFINLLNSAS